ncbi:MAG: hypothetical protein R6U44_01395 [Archaeoglobaceae archaeon]
MIPKLDFFVTCFLFLIGIWFWLYLLLELTYKITRYHSEEKEILRLLRVGRVYLLLASPLALSLYFTFGEELLPKYGIDVLWVYYGVSYTILVAARIISNPHHSIVDRGWEFHKEEINTYEEELGVKTEYIYEDLKPRIQGIIMPLSFIVVIFIFVKAALIVFTNESLPFLYIPEANRENIISFVYMVLGVIPAVLISESILYLAKPHYQD